MTVHLLLVEPSQKARFLACLAPYSGDWLLALPSDNCDEASLCPYQHTTWLELVTDTVDQMGVHGRHAMLCKKAPGRFARHQALNDMIWRTLGSAEL